MIQPRSTVASRVEIEGVGLHSGCPVEVFIHPSDRGIEFRYEGTVTRATPANVTETTRCTKVGPVATVEHLMAALAALEITDAVIEVSAPELPSAGGCASPYVEAIRQVGVKQFASQEVPVLFRRLFFQEGAIKLAVGKGSGHWRYEYEVEGRWPHSMIYETPMITVSFESEVAPARTFAHADEIPQIQAAGLARGLDTTSALILGAEGFQNPARFPNEPARHKLLDLAGDLYLAGVPMRMLNVVGTRSGHRTNVLMAMMLHTAVWGHS